MSHYLRFLCVRSEGCPALFQTSYFLLTEPMAKQGGVTEALKAADQIEWVRRMNSIRNRAEEIVLHGLVYDL